MTYIVLMALAGIAYAATAIWAPEIIAKLTRRHLRRPHTALLTIFRLWFALLSAATFWVLFHLHRPPR